MLKELDLNNYNNSLIGLNNTLKSMAVTRQRGNQKIVAWADERISSHEA